MQQIDWESVYEDFKQIPTEKLLKSKSNQINKYITNDAPHKLLKLMIERFPKSELLESKHESGNIPLHYLLGSIYNSGGFKKKEIDHALVRLIIKKAPESFFIENDRGSLPIHTIHPDNYAEYRLIVEDAMLEGNEYTPDILQNVLLNLPSHSIFQKLTDDVLKFISKNKSRIHGYKLIQNHIINLKNNYNKSLQEEFAEDNEKRTKQLIDEEEREKMKALKRKEIEEKVRLAKLEQERKELIQRSAKRIGSQWLNKTRTNKLTKETTQRLKILQEEEERLREQSYETRRKEIQLERELAIKKDIEDINRSHSARFIQQRYRFKNKVRNARKHGVNPGARPYQPPKHLLETLPRSIDDFTIEENLPFHNEISNPWRYTKEYPGNFPVFQFYKSKNLLRQLYTDLKKLT